MTDNSVKPKSEKSTDFDDAKDAGPSEVTENENFIRRNNPCDCYKPNSDHAVYVLAETPLSEQLTLDETGMLRKVAADMDRVLPTDIIEGFPILDVISEESRKQLARLPTWLRSMIESRWEIIHAHYGHDVHNFLRVIANRIDSQYRTQYLKVIGTAVSEEDQTLLEQTATGFQLLQSDLDEREREVDPIVKERATFMVAGFVGKFKAHNYTKRYWETHMIKRAESSLRTAMITRAAASDMAVIIEEDTITDLGKMNKEGFDSDDEGGPKTKHWDTFNADDKELLRKEAKDAVDCEYHLKSSDHLSRDEKKALKIKKKMLRMEKKKNKIGCWSYLRTHPLFASSTKRKERKKYLLERALYRRYSRIWYKGCGDPIQHSKKSGHQYRTDEKIHSYIVSLVTWSLFKLLIMFIITCNAVLLALETGDQPEDWIPVFEILDIFFLSIYTVEFLLKFYSHPYKYWKSGYNVFDFIILMISLTKKLIDWLGYTEISVLKVLLIVRALRILRGVSLSVQLQVLVTALAETIKTHVLSVVLLLVLLLYVSSIVAYYLFGDKDNLREDWGNVAYGMFQMFTFVTMDGWTEIIGRFEDAGLFHEGRVFGVVCIVLANFLFSNIFIAIIIMNISEATDAYRERQSDEREEVVSRKKDIVFRRQKLDMRQLLARQKMSISADFFHMGSQFQRLLRHDDLVAMQEVCTSPLWMDCLFKTITRCHHTSVILMNLHRELADALFDCYEFHATSRYEVEPMRRARYNRYMLVKAKLALIKREIYRYRHPEKKSPMKVRLPQDSDDEHPVEETANADANKLNIDYDNNVEFYAF